MTKEEDYLYEHAPLVEVIAELRWQLVPIASMPGAELDPNFERSHGKVADNLAKLGFGHIERLPPSDFPSEMLAGQPVFRYRRAPNTWPLFQLGPGLFTANITPPYEGWADFRVTLEAGLGALDAAFQLGTEFAMPRLIELRYLDAFTEQHGVDRVAEFMTEHLSLDLKPSDRLRTAIMHPESEHVPLAELRFPLARDPQDVFVLKATPGTREGRPAVILDLRVRRSVENGAVTNAAEALKWLDAAHADLHEAFENTISDKLRERLGERRPVRS
ncbi:TIGR04255 family protein [Tranquillimonas alkanivorans]|uniref:TIGR04255 family protein n=1 Tax=Tranquillimonas alkanivorans TaxID=441119 RepID=A0A1I5W293_9RHOB|nr:TIGR04255 family protein [Tranquillimonas alkanivorans]SFQ13855.1 TIGR04255 family protein [Tranquillimonas alkanivorans]